MSLALLKNTLFPADRRSQRPQTDDSINSHDSLTLQPETSSELPAHKEGEGSWLSIKSSVGFDPSKRSSSSALPLPEKNISAVTAKEHPVDDVEAQRRRSFTHNREEVRTKRWNFKLSPRMISDAIIGISDGMTVPFALTAGLSSLGNARIVVLAGLAELVAGALSMGLGGFVGAKSEAQSYRATVATTEKMIQESPFQTANMVHEVFKPYGLSAMTLNNIIKSLHSSPAEMLDFLMRFHHQLAEPDTSRPFVCAITISMGYFLGGLVPLIPYFCVKKHEVMLALYWSIGVMAIALFAFGWVKTGVVVGWRGKANILAGLKGALQMAAIGGIAAAAAVGLVRAIEHT